MKSLEDELFSQIPLPGDMVYTHYKVSKKASEYFGRPYTTPNFGLFPELEYTDVLGFYDPLSSTVGYNPRILPYRNVRTSVAKHEAAHASQPGLMNLLCIYALLIGRDGSGYIFPIGKAIAEGAAEKTLEEIGESRTGAYEREYRLVEGILKSTGIDLRYLHSLAESNPEKLVYLLNQPGTKRVVMDYISEYSRIGYN